MLKMNLPKRRGRAKTKIEDKRKAVMKKIMESCSEEFDVKMAVIQELIPLLTAGSIDQTAGRSDTAGRQKV